MSYNLLFACDWKWGIPWFTPNGKLKKLIHDRIFGEFCFQRHPSHHCLLGFPPVNRQLAMENDLFFHDLPIENDVFSVRYVSLPDRISSIFQCRWPFIGDFPLPRLSTRGYPKKMSLTTGWPMLMWRRPCQRLRMFVRQTGPPVFLMFTH